LAALEKMLKEAGKKADEAELFYCEEERTEMRSVLGKIESCDYNHSNGFGLRVIKKGRIGFSYFSEEKDFSRALKSALQSAGFSKKLGAGFPEKSAYRIPKGLYSDEIKRMNEDVLLGYLVSMIDAFKGLEAHSVQNLVAKSSESSVLANTSGVFYEDEKNVLDAVSVAQFEKCVSSCAKVARSDLGFAGIAERSAFLAKKFSGAKPLKGEMDVILHPKAASDIFAGIFPDSVDGEEVFRKQSPFSEKLGKQVASSGISIYDNPLIDAGVSSFGCDEEGTPAR
jgi:PmbA protein